MRAAEGHIFTAITAGFFHTCALDTRGETWCWGYNGHGQLGDDSSSDEETPVVVRFP